MSKGVIVSPANRGVQVVVTDEQNVQLLVDGSRNINLEVVPQPRTEILIDKSVPGPNGQGVPTGGTTGQALVKTSDADYETGWSDTVPNALTADNATHATNADYATNAGHAAIADSATSVSHSLTAIADGTTKTYDGSVAVTIGSVPALGVAGQVLAKVDATDYNVAWIDNYSTALKTIVKNQTGTTLVKGTVVYVSDGTGANILVSKAQANSEATSSQTFGFLENDIANGSSGYVINQGTLIGIDTSAYADGDPVFLSPTVAGGWVAGLANKPYAPYHLVYLGVITRSQQNNGVIAVKVQNGYELDELHNVSARTPTTGQTIVYNAATGLWEKNTVSLTAGVNGVLSINNGGTNASTADGALSNLGAYPASNPNGYTSNTGTVTSVNGTGSVNGLTLTGTVTSSGNLALGGTLNLSSPPAIGSTTPNTGAFTSGAYPAQSSAPGTPSSGFVQYASSTGMFSWKGTNGFVRQFDGSSLTADRTWVLPNLAGNLLLSDGMAIGQTTPAAGTFTTLIGGGGSANYGQLTGGATTKAVQFQTLGSDTNISAVFQSKGTGAIDLAAGSSGVNISNGGTVTAITRTSGGTLYTSVPSIALSAPTTAGGVQATASITVSLNSISAIVSGGTGYTVNDTLTVVGGTGTAVVLTVATVSSGVITAVTISNFGSYSVAPSNPMTVTGGTGTGATFTANFGVQPTITITNAGSGYVEQPTISFSGGGGSGAAAYATVGSGTVVRSLGVTLDFYTPNQQIGFRLQDFPQGSGTGYWTAFGGNQSPILRAVGAGSGAIQTQSAVPLQFGTNNGVEQLRVAHTASAVNYVQVTGAATGNSVVLSSQGSDTNIGMIYNFKGTSSHSFNGNNGTHFQVTSVASGANFLRATGSAAGAAPVLSTQGSDTNIDLALTPKGTGVVQFGTYTATILTPTGYITIKDAGGTIRRVLIG